MLKRTLRQLSLLLILAALMGFASLHALAEEPVLSLDKTELTLDKGDFGYLQLTVKDNAAFSDVVVGSTRQDVAVAEYNDIGKRITVETRGGGETTISLRGRVNGQEETISFLVKVNSPVTSVQIEDADQILSVGDDTFDFDAVYAPNDATDTVEVWRSSDPTVATIESATGKVKALAPGKTVISVTVGGMAAAQTRTVWVSGLTLKGPVGVTLLPDGSVPLLVGKSTSLDYGIYGAAEDKLPIWTSSDMTVAGVSNGNVYAYNPGTTTITLTAGHYTVSIDVTVQEDIASAVLRDLSAGENLLFSDILDDLKDRAHEKLGSNMDLVYISALSADPEEGVLYFGYRSPEAPGMGVGNLDRFYVDPTSAQMGISGVTFVPNPNFGGTAVITYVGYGGNGVPYNGRIRVTVEKSGDVSYSTTAGQVLFFSGEDFNAACKVRTGQALRYVTFRLPAKAQGSLYQSYNTAGQYMPQVSASSKYYLYGSTLLIDKIAFVPQEGYTGTVNIPYVATDSSGTSYNGTVTIEVNPASGGSGWVDGAVSYTTSGQAVRFAGEDFNAACKKSNGKALKYLNITPPAEAEGKLWLNYTSAAKPGTAVTADTRLTVSDLSKLTFVPKEGYAGTVTLQFTGEDTSGAEFKGTATIKVLAYDVQVDYTTGSLAVTFDPEDFRFSCVSALPKKLAAVVFHELPANYAGKLLYDYKGVGTGSAVEEGVRYNYSGTPALGKISFVPKADYQGTVVLSYTAYDTDGNTVGGAVTIRVSHSYAKAEFSDLTGYSSAIPAIEYLKANSVIGGYSDGTFRPTAATSRAAYAAMVCRLFGFEAKAASAPFPDVKKDSWCADVVAAAKQFGVVAGDKKGMFNPTASVTKQQAIVMLQRAMQAAGWEIETTSTVILLNYRDNASVSSYARSAMANMIGMGVVEADAYGYLRPDEPITRVEMAMILYRLLTR